MNSLPDSPTQTDREYAVYPVRAELFGAVVVIRAGKRRAVYVLEEVTPDPEHPSADRVFHLLRLSKPHPEFGPYRVVIGPTPDCSCVGFGRWNSCKHLSFLTDYCS